ncbi:MAG: hypothetical protein KUL88_01720 [Rhizobium sp.]|nr:hypothetical protein [Rhizobium sp.]
MTMPDEATLRADYARDPNTKHLADRYGMPYTTLRAHLVRIGLFAKHSKNDPTILLDATRADRITVGRMISASEYGGSVRKPFSLPRVTMHVAALEERRP